MAVKTGKKFSQAVKTIQAKYSGKSPSYVKERLDDGDRIGISRSMLEAILKCDAENPVNGSGASFSERTQRRLIQYLDSNSIPDELYHLLVGQCEAYRQDELLSRYIKPSQNHFKYIRKSPNYKHSKKLHTGYLRFERENKKFYFQRAKSIDNEANWKSAEHSGVLMRIGDLMYMIGMGRKVFRLAVFPKKEDLATQPSLGVVLSRTERGNIFASRFVLVHQSHPLYNGHKDEEIISMLENDFDESGLLIAPDSE